MKLDPKRGVGLFTAAAAWLVLLAGGSRGDPTAVDLSAPDAKQSWLFYNTAFVHVCTDAGAGGYEAFPDVCRLSDGRLMCVFYAGYGHVSKPNGRFVAAVRLYDGRVRTALCWIDPEKGTLKEFLKLPSGGDTSYPGMVWHERLLWVSYYASHEGKSSIYLAKVRFSPKAR